ncbi:MAG TPA: pantoate--beta-alanine ligase [Vicinamibacterales bacterium]|nr:pantoate--beta-alanine ligase [Vicinamibacterales bacterium]
MTMAAVETIAALRQRLDEARHRQARIGFVPTMGALHEGHARLIARARSECDRVVASIFVNPLQFDRPDDLARYPRTLADDLALCESLGVDDVFVPAAAEMYPSTPQCTVEVGELADHLCGKYRPGHFRGVATVVLKLLQIVQPHAAYFGEKDAQQLAIVRRLVTDFSVPVAIVGVPTVREPDGLAMSSRNRRLDPCERKLATALFRALSAAAEAIRAGQTDAAEVKRLAQATVPPPSKGDAAASPASPTLRIEYLEVVDPDTMQPVAQIEGPVIVAGALWVGSTRLIDNIRV